MKTSAVAIGDAVRLEESQILPRSFYERPTVDVARELLGKVLMHGRTAGRIVEVEAYLGLEDLAAHASRGITDRTRVLFGAPGHAYVYFIYGMYECLNLVAEPEGTPGCVLIRALEPLSGIEVMQRRRPKARSIEDLASGPGKLTLAMGITRRHNGADVTSPSTAWKISSLGRGGAGLQPARADETVCPTPDLDRTFPNGRRTRGSLTVRTLAEDEAFEIGVSPRIGIRRCADWPLRFYVAGNRFVSRKN